MFGDQLLERDTLVEGMGCGRHHLLMGGPKLPY